jgi:hypothetical protein
MAGKFSLPPSELHMDVQSLRRNLGPIDGFTEDSHLARFKEMAMSNGGPSEAISCLIVTRRNGVRFPAGA